jgi:hypothetical protein
MGTVTERQDYVIHASSGDPDLAAVCAAVHDSIELRAALMQVDVHSDHSEEMPPDIRAVRDHIGQCALEQSILGSELIATIRPHEKTAWAFARAYTPWSISVDVFDADNREIACFHDCGWSIVAYLSASEAGELAEKVPGHLVEPLLLVRESRREEKLVARRARLRNLLRLNR